MLRIWILGLCIVLTVGCDGGDTGNSDNNANNTANNGDTTVTFQNLRIEDLSSVRAVARFETSIPTTCAVAYGLTADALTQSAVDPDMPDGQLSLTHNVPLEDLAPGTEYFWQGVVVDSKGTETRSKVQSFKTPSDGEETVLTNFALKGSVTAVSSNFGGGDNDSTWGANNTIDGQMSTEWATNGDGDNASITIKLDAQQTITHVALRSRKMSDGTSIIEAFEVSFDGGAPLGPFATPDPDQRYEFKLPEPVEATSMTLNVTKTTGGNVGAKEIEILGEGSVESACGGDDRVVDFMTSDGIKLVGDYWPATSANKGAVVLIHMIPPSWDRKSYPVRVRKALHDAGYSILNIDRRGAGDSTQGDPDPKTAYTGDTARLDAEAAVRFLVSADCAVDTSKLMLVGASNGTTTVMDYTVNRSDSALPGPAAIVWLSPGEYTENQNSVAQNTAKIEAIPVLIVHPANEPWANKFASETPEGWKVIELANGKHGTQNFDDGALEAIQLPAIVDWANGHIAP